MLYYLIIELKKYIPLALLFSLLLAQYTPRVSAEDYYDAGVKYMEFGQYKEAIEMLETGINMKPVFPDAINMLGVCYTKKEEYEKAIEFYEKALEQAGDHGGYMLNIAISHFMMGNKGIAKQKYDEAVALDPVFAGTGLDKVFFPAKGKPKYPAFLTIENLEFSEPSGNQSLDGLETGKLTIDLVNKGKGYATNIEIDITPLSSGKNLEYNSKTTIKKLSSKSSKTIEIPFTADIKTKSTDRKFRIEITEHFGFDADPALISFTTTAFAPPDLQVNQTAIDDDDEGDSFGDGNSIIEAGEAIEVTAFVQNFGDGDAEDVNAEVVFNTTDSHITYPDEGQIYNLGDITSGDYKELKFYFYTSKRYKNVDLPISVELTESKGAFGKTIGLGLKAGERTQNIVDVQIARVESQERQKTMREIEGIITLADVDKNIPETNEDGENTLAVIVGIQDYKYAPNVDYADRDAQYFYEYSKSVLGIPEPNIYFRLDDGATSGEFNKIFAEDGWIARRMGPSTDIIFYYSGHGAPDPKSEKGFLIPHDIDPNYANTGFSLDEIYESLSALEANSVSVFIDACFSGESRSEEMLIAGIRPISIEIASPVLTAENFSVFSASTGKQYSSAYPEKFHGLFTYFLLKGLQGEAKGRDKKLTLGELYDYVEKNVSRQAGYLDKEQNPTFIGSNENRVIVRY
jgi:hypothetical protein